MKENLDKRTLGLIIALIVAIIAVVVLVVLLLFGKKNDSSNIEYTDEYDETVEIAMKELTQAINEYIDGGNTKASKKFSIVNTQVVVLKDNPVFEENKVHFENAYNIFLKDVELIVEFTVKADVYGYGAEYSNIGHPLCTDVIFYKDGRIEMGHMVLNMVGAHCYDYDFSSVIEKTVDLGGKFDRVIIAD